MATETLSSADPTTLTVEDVLGGRTDWTRPALADMVDVVSLWHAAGQDGRSQEALETIARWQEKGWGQRTWPSAPEAWERWRAQRPRRLE